MTELPPDMSGFKMETIREGWLVRSPESPADISGISMEMTRENPIIGVHRYPVDARRLVPVYDDPPKPPVKPRRAKPTHGPWFQAIVILEIMVAALCGGVLVAVLIWG